MKKKIEQNGVRREKALIAGRHATSRKETEDMQCFIENWLSLRDHLLIFNS